jgi:hypothetical protein
MRNAEWGKAEGELRVESSNRVQSEEWEKDKG